MSKNSFLQKHLDPLGHSLLDYCDNDSPGLIKVYSDVADPEYLNPGYFFRNFPEFPQLEKLAIQNCMGTTLDVGAGAGAHALALQKRGIPVTAIEISQLAVEVMEKRGVADAQLADFFQLPDEQRFDTLLMLMNGVGISGTLEGLDRLLAKATSLLKPGGRLILDSSDVAYLFEDNEELKAWSRQMNRYYGQVTYQMTYKNTEGNPFYWLFVDYHTLQKHARRHDLIPELIYAGPHHQYLARLTKRS